MADWTNIADANVDPDAPLLASVVRALRDNPAAIAQGAAGATKINGSQGPAVETGGLTDACVTAPKLATGSAESVWVRERLTAVGVGELGTYALLKLMTGVTVNPGDVVAGSSLRYSGGISRVVIDVSALPSSLETVASTPEGAAPAGSWRLMGYLVGSTPVGVAAEYENQLGLFIRVA